jgi:cephalosporin hydroxylase
MSAAHVEPAINLLDELVAVDHEDDHGQRFVPLAQRLRDVGGRRSQPPLGFLLSQGVNRPPLWKGAALYKSVWDLALYSELLWDLRPGAIVELGSGEGASADWFATLCQAYELDAEVVSFDAEPPAVPASAAVTFVQATFPDDVDRLTAWCETLPADRPWLVVEDMHVGVELVLPRIAAALRPGDYLVVEDSGSKQGVLAELAESTPSLVVDRAYVDKFGLNGTSAMNSVLKVS